MEEVHVVRSGEMKYPVKTVLYEIYRLRGLTIDQMVRTIFESKKYAIRYLKALSDKGLLVGKVYNHGQKRIGMQYFITEKGIEYLENEGLVKKYGEDEMDIDELENKRSLKYSTLTQTGSYIPRKILAYDNNQGMRKDKVIFTMYANEIYAGVVPYGIYMYDSREWKLKYSMNTNSFVRGGLRMRDGRDYSLYILFSNDEIKNAKVTENMLKKIFYEIQENRQSERYILYVYGKNDYSHVVTFFRKNVVAGKEMLIIPHGVNEIGLHMIRMLSDANKHKSNLESELNARLYNGDELENSTASIFADYLTEINGEEYYVLDYLRLNELKLEMLKHQYTRERYERIKKKVLILCWSFMESDLSDIYRVYEHIDVKGVSLDNLLKWNNDIDKKKLYMQQ